MTTEGTRSQGSHGDDPGARCRPRGFRVLVPGFRVHRVFWAFQLQMRPVYAEAGCGWMRPKRGVVLSGDIGSRWCCSCRVWVEGELRLTCDDQAAAGRGSCDWPIPGFFGTAVSARVRALCIKGSREIHHCKDSSFHLCLKVRCCAPDDDRVLCDLNRRQPLFTITNLSFNRPSVITPHRLHNMAGRLSTALWSPQDIARQIPRGPLFDYARYL